MKFTPVYVLSIEAVVEMHKTGPESLIDVEGSRGQSASTNYNEQESVIIFADRRITTEKIASQPGIGRGSAHCQEFGNIEFYRVFGR